MTMVDKEERKNNILLGAFKLFLSKEYGDVVTADLEEATGGYKRGYLL